MYLIRPVLLVPNDLVEPVEDVEPVDDLTEDAVRPVEVVEVLLQRDEELRSVEVVSRGRHGEGALLGVADPRVLLAVDVLRLVAVQTTVHTLAAS